MLTELPADKELPADQDERLRIRNVRNSTLFVDAGAGTGKTRSLIDRVEALVFEDGIAIDSIAVITFTEKAAAELYNRIRHRFEQRLGSGDDESARAALDQLDSAAICTLHSFAQRILMEHPVAAGLPPGIEVFDEIGSHIGFESRWTDFLNELFDDPAVHRSLLILDTTGVGPKALRVLALQMTSNWDLVESRLRLDPPPPPRFEVDGLLAEFDRVLAMRSACVSTDDKLMQDFDRLESNRNDLTAAFDEIDALTAAAAMGEGASRSRNESKAIRPGRRGRAANWRIDVAEVREALKNLATLCDDAVASVTTPALDYVGGYLGRFVLDSAEQRRTSGRLDFHDLLVRARRLVRDRTNGPAVRRGLHQRYKRLLLDEFQDTDPIQIELAMLIASSDPADSMRDWREIVPDPGRLFVVGDPKQSIYRFRRADIEVYLNARDSFGDHVDLRVNFRSTSPIVGWVNDVFAELMQPDRGQPAYQPLVGYRQAEVPDGPAVSLLSAQPVDEPLKADDLREREAKLVAATIADALYGPRPWSVHTPNGTRQAEPDDVCVLLPARTSLAVLERALFRAGISYRTETSSHLYATREVRELMLALRAVADPTDELATVSALRSFVYGCGDDDLARWRHSVGGRFNLLAPVDESTHGDPVADALMHLRRLHEDRRWTGPAELLDRLIRERGVVESAVASHNPRGVWRRLRFVVDHARAWADAGGTDLRDYLDWARLQGADNAGVSETVLPESDDRSIRIMTIHGAKGLEFPITVLSGMTTRFSNPQRGPAVLFPPDEEVILKASTNVTSEGYDAWKPIDDQMDDHERIRLLYVAATRARDHLVVSLVRNPGNIRTGASVLAEPALRSVHGVAWDPEPAVARSSAIPERASVPQRDVWLNKRSGVMTAASRRRVVAATTLARAATEADDPGLAKAPRDLDLPPWQKGRFGTAIGRAVHGVLQLVDLSTGAGLTEAAAAQAMAEGVANRTRIVAELARSALGTPIARTAAKSRHWREVWVAAPVGDHLVEGYVDLLYRTPKGLVVVDWKTDRIDGSGPQDKVSRYRMQGASYAVAVEAATGEPVHEMVFVFLDLDGATEARLPDLQSAMREVIDRAAELSERSAVVEPFGEFV